MTPVNSIWFSWTAPTTASVQVDTLGSDFDTYLHAYTGTGLGSLTEVACNDDVPLSGHSQAAVFFDATAGTTYLFQVDGAGAASGNVTLNWGPTPTMSPTGVLVNPEGDTGSTFWDMPVTLSGPSTVPITLDWATGDIPANPNVAHPGSDFVAASGTVTFMPGETVQYATIEILGDLVDEPPLLWGEWGIVGFSNAAYTKVVGGLFGHALIIIIDDD